MNSPDLTLAEAKPQTSPPQPLPATPPEQTQALAEQVLEGLSATQKFLPSAWFYDDEGSRLFQRIMALPEYYLTRVEHALLRERAQELSHWFTRSGCAIDLIELGSGDGEKSLTLCQALHAQATECTYWPMDLSAHALDELTRRFDRHLPRMALAPVLGDYFAFWPATSPKRRQVAMLLGSNLGNFDEAGATVLLRRIRAQLRPGDLLVLGLDLVKDPHVLLAAYNDAQGVTAAFNLNLLRRLNRELDMDFDLDRFSHYASYCPLQGVARSFLVSRDAQSVHSRLLQRSFSFGAGETIYTEQSQKYTEASMAALAHASGFERVAVLSDEQQWYALALWQVA